MYRPRYYGFTHIERVVHRQKFLLPFKLSRCGRLPPTVASETMPRTVASESQLFELGTCIKVFWTDENKWYDGIIKDRRNQGGRRSQTPTPAPSMPNHT